ncbi:MAG: HlyC/CorC family transporter [Clostridia bacterium]|nr:HlyC/CorC family transporter [Clostridia bacterium]
MDGSTVPLWLAFVFFVIAGAYFAGAESSFSAVNKIRVKARADEGNKRAKGVLYVLNHFEKALTTLLVGNNITHIAAASVAAVLATRLYAGKGVDVNSFGFTMACTVVSTGVVFLFSEMIPKSLANDRSETFSMFTNSSLRFLMKALTPISAFFGMISNAASRLFASKEEEPTITEDELIEIFDTATEEGVVDEEQKDILKSALEFDHTVVGDVMTMAKDIESLNVAASTEEILQCIRTVNHSRIPVYSGSPDHVIGTLRIRKFLTEYHKNPKVRLRNMLTPPYFVREDAKIDELLDEMRQKKNHIAIVVDEHKKAVGLVTIEDFLEELVGEIFDEEDVVDNNFQALGGNKYRVNTHMLMGNIYERMGLATASRRIAAKPVLSFMLERVGSLPAEGESFLYENLEFTVVTVENQRPTEVLIHILDEEDLAARAAQGEEATV